MTAPASKRFLIVGSFLRPQNLLAYKTQIQHRDDIAYPFYQDFEGYKETEDQAWHKWCRSRPNAGCLK